MLLPAQPNAEEIEQDPEDGEGGDGEDYTGETCEFTAGDNGEKYQDGVHVESLALDAGGQEVAFELLDQDVRHDRQDSCGRRGLEVGRPEDQGHYDSGYTPQEGAEVGDDRRDRNPHAEQDGVAHAEQIQRRSGQYALDHYHEDEPAEVARERLAEGFPQVAGVVTVVGRYGLENSGLHFPHVHQEVDGDEDYAEERYPEVESPGDKPEEAPEQVLGKVLGAVEEIGDQPPAELFGVRARYQLALVQRVYNVEQELVGAVGDAGRSPYEGAQLLYHERHEEEESQRNKSEHGQNGQQDRQPPWHEMREGPHRKREHDGQRHPAQGHGGNGGRRVQKEREQGNPHHDDADPDPRRDEDRGHVAAGRRFPLPTLVPRPPGPPFVPHRLRFSLSTRLRFLFYGKCTSMEAAYPPRSAGFFLRRRKSSYRRNPANSKPRPASATDTSMLSEKVPAHRSTEKARSVAPPEAYKPSRPEVPSETINRTPIATNIRPERKLVVCKRSAPREISRPLSQRRRPRSRRSQSRAMMKRGAAMPAA